MSREAPLNRKALASTSMRPGIIPYLQCDRQFRSWDVRGDRICRRCHEVIDREPTPEAVQALRRPRGRVD
jgi:hypothetical protein